MLCPPAERASTLSHRIDRIIVSRSSTHYIPGRQRLRSPQANHRTASRHHFQSQGNRNLSACQQTASIKGKLSNLCHRTGTRQICQRTTSLEGRNSNVGHRIRNHQAGHRIATREGTVSNLCDRDRNLQVCQRTASLERRLPNLCHRNRNVQGGQ